MTLNTRFLRLTDCQNPTARAEKLKTPKATRITKRSNTMPLVAYNFVLPKKYSPLVDAFILLTSKFGLRQIPQYPTVKISTNLGKNLLKTGSVWN